jgi:hypothetical protein
MASTPERYHWLYTIVGLLDQAFHLDDADQLMVIETTNNLLDRLDIPGRSDPQAIPAPLALELTSSYYSRSINSARNTTFVYPSRVTNDSDIVVSVTAWCDMMLALLLTSYPDITPIERLVIVKVFSTVLDALGVPDRAASFYPDEILRVALEVDA